MKALIMICAVLVALVNVPSVQELTVDATYEGWEDGVYTFMGEDELEYEFSEIRPDASKKFNLESEEFVGKKFKVTYKVDLEPDENDEEYEVYIIVDLSLID